LAIVATHDGCAMCALWQNPQHVRDTVATASFNNLNGAVLMDSTRNRVVALGRAIVVSLGLATCLLLTGCQSLGPAALGVGRGAYNEVIARTSSEQMLGFLVRLRYADPTGLLTVSSVTAGLKFSTQARGEAGFGPHANYAGNLVPFSATFGYEDSPTISYVPVDTQAFVREWLAPVTLETLMLMLQTGARQDAFILLLIERMNGLRNNVNVPVEERAAFQRAAALLSEFRDFGIAAWAQQSGATGRYELILSKYSPGHVAEVQELLDLLELKSDPVRESIIRIPVAFGIRERDFDGLTVQTRSVSEIILTAARSVEVPGEDEGVVEAGAEYSGTLSLPVLKIHSSRNAPDRANIAVQHRGRWFYVDDTDLASKRMFQRIQILFLTRLSDATRGTQTAPLLTIPVK
jgi:hypothetical protein